MIVDFETLNKLAHQSERVNGHLLNIVTGLASPDPGRQETAMRHAWEAQRVNTLLLQRLMLLGADDPSVAETAALRGLLEDVPTSASMPFEMLSTPATRRYAEALRACAEACRDMETERGIEDGLTEMFDIYAESAELEAFGPIGSGKE